MIAFAALLLLGAPGAAAPARVERFAVFEAEFQAASAPANPYTALDAEAVFTRPGGGSWRVPLFWDGGRTWKVRVSPDAAGTWRYVVKSADAGLNGRSGSFACVASKRPGGLRASRAYPGHFERQDGAPFWFMGDTAWGYFTDSAEEKHDRARAEYYAKKRAAQGFNVIHCMLMSEQGVGNRNGPPFDEIGAERINPGYWREVDERLAWANRHGLTVGLALAWGDKRGKEPFAWRRLPNPEARRRYARYIGARYSAYDVYFLVSGEWHAEVRARGDVTDDLVFREFVEIGKALDAADPHGRMIGIHPMTRHGSVREFAAAPWMSFADYQQNYTDLHADVLLSARLRGPVVNSEYGYHLRDSNGDGKPDKDNSYSAEDMRFASWDIATAGGYLVTGFGTTYFAGFRDPGPFDPDAAKNRDWEEQIGHLKKFFEGLEWWKLAPADELISSRAQRTGDRRENGLHPPATTYWAMAAPGETYVLYVRGTREAVELDPGARTRRYAVRQYNPRSGEFTSLGEASAGRFKYQPPDEQDWVVLLQGR